MRYGFWATTAAADAIALAHGFLAEGSGRLTRTLLGVRLSRHSVRA
jgi:hypothetical protein